MRYKDCVVPVVQSSKEKWFPLLFFIFSVNGNQDCSIAWEDTIQIGCPFLLHTERLLSFQYGYDGYLQSPESGEREQCRGGSIH